MSTDAGLDHIILGSVLKYILLRGVVVKDAIKGELDVAAKAHDADEVNS
jgi:hypothetical protein